MDEPTTCTTSHILTLYSWRVRILHMRIDRRCSNNIPTQSVFHNPSNPSWRRWVYLRKGTIFSAAKNMCKRWLHMCFSITKPSHDIAYQLYGHPALWQKTTITSILLIICCLISLWSTVPFSIYATMICPWTSVKSPGPLNIWRPTLKHWGRFGLCSQPLRITISWISVMVTTSDSMWCLIIISSTAWLVKSSTLHVPMYSRKLQHMYSKQLWGMMRREGMHPLTDFGKEIWSARSWKIEFHVGSFADGFQHQHPSLPLHSDFLCLFDQCISFSPCGYVSASDNKQESYIRKTEPESAYFLINSWWRLLIFLFSISTMKTPTCELYISNEMSQGHVTVTLEGSWQLQSKIPLVENNETHFTLHYSLRA